jgi:hypothetical protein
MCEGVSNDFETQWLKINQKKIKILNKYKKTFKKKNLTFIKKIQKIKDLKRKINKPI